MRIYVGNLKGKRAARLTPRVGVESHCQLNHTAKRSIVILEDQVLVLPAHWLPFTGRTSNTNPWSVSRTRAKSRPRVEMESDSEALGTMTTAASRPGPARARVRAACPLTGSLPAKLARD